MIECPYCLAQIPDRASTCQFCTNPVSLLLETRTKLAESEQKLANAIAQIRQLTGEDPVEPKPAEKWSPLLAVFVFYAASIFATVSTPASYMMPLLLVMAALFGLVIATRDPAPNVWGIAMVAFAQPLLATPVLIFRNPGEALASQVVQIVRDGFVIALQLSAAAIASAGLYMLFFRRDRLQPSLRPPTVTQATAGADRIIKLITVIATGLTTVITVISILGRYLAKGGT